MATSSSPHTQTAATTHISSTGVLLITNDEQKPTESYAFTFAITCAGKGQVPVTLYDRSEETWGDSQHPEGPLAAGDQRLENRPELAEQIAWIDEHEVSGQGWVSTLPSITGVLTALAQVGADTVVVPAHLSPNLFERALQGDSVAASIAEQISRNPELEAHVFEVDENGAVTEIGAAVER